MTRQQKIIILSGAILVATALVGWVYRSHYLAQPTFFEVTFLDSHQAIVYWKTRQASIGFVQMGPQKNKLDTQIFQTSSQPGETHAVFLEKIPLEGVYIQLHTEKESPFSWPQKQKIQFQENESGEPNHE